MSEKPGKKRIVIYIIIFVAFALLIVFLSNRTSNKTMSDVGYGGGMESVVGMPMGDVMPVDMMEPMMESPVAPEVKARNSQTTTVVTADNVGGEVAVDKKVIKTGSIDMRVNSVEDSMDEIRWITNAHGGDEVSSDISKSDTYKNGFIVVKVPVNQYAETFAAIKRIAPLVIDESSQSQDVTARFIDLESRIKNKKEHEERLRSFFKKADDVDELIQVERELARVRTEVESMEGQLKYLKDQTQYSTINVSLREDSSIVVSDSWRPMQVVTDSFNTLIKKATNLLNIVIRFTITSLPFIIIFAVGAWFLYFAAKHIFGKKSKEDNK
ncbi:MAG: DUF4349 domain-containing protein [Candidatus Moraniibacteriota bacterium]|jgi:uncharacterized protein DUF4349